MLDILEIAREDGMKQGELKGQIKGQIKTWQMLLQDSVSNSELIQRAR